LQKQHRHYELYKCEEVEHGQGGKQEDDECHNEHSEVEFLQTELVAVHSVPHDVELFAVEQIYEGAHHFKDVVVDPRNCGVQYENVAGTDKQDVVD